MSSSIPRTFLSSIEHTSDFKGQCHDVFHLLVLFIKRKHLLIQLIPQSRFEYGFEYHDIFNFGHFSVWVVLQWKAPEALPVKSYT
jgi:hypothetical protein